MTTVPDDYGCDLPVDGACALVDGADVVVNMLPSSIESRVKT